MSLTLQTRDWVLGRELLDPVRLVPVRVRPPSPQCCWEPGPGKAASSPTQASTGLCRGRNR